VMDDDGDEVMEVEESDDDCDSEDEDDEDVFVRRSLRRPRR
jgi:hypothetical protein